ncbi:hypothetical protein DEEACLCL_00013 [Salmonella phage CRW-SP2]|nr:hypothetical protein DEEACLCL_00013 [Salmonella phage CRW-SP2]
MQQKNYIFIRPLTHQFFCSDAQDAIEGFHPLKPYKLASGGVDQEAFNCDRQALLDAGWSEIQSPQYIPVTLYYMKDSGKFYSEGTLKISRAAAEENPAKSWLEVMDHIRYLMDSGDLPGLVKGSRFEVFVTGEGHPGGYPQLFRINN